MTISTPGFCRPIALSMPDGVSAMRLGSFPARGLRVVPLVTIAPRAERSTWGASKPYANVPEATRSGVRRRRPRPRSTESRGASAMKDIPHPGPVQLIGADAGAVLAGEEVAAIVARRDAGQARPQAAAHRRLEGDLDRGRRDPNLQRALDQRL